MVTEFYVTACREFAWLGWDALLGELCMQDLVEWSDSLGDEVIVITRGLDIEVLDEAVKTP